MTLNKKDQERNPFEESFSTVSNKFKTYEPPKEQEMPYYHQDSYSTISDQRTASDDSVNQNYPSQQFQYSSHCEPVIQQQAQFMDYQLEDERQYANSKQVSSKKRNRSLKFPQDEEKRKNFLERNRLAALKCRQRKKQWLLNLQTRIEFLTNDNDQLQMESEALRKEVMELKTLLLAHKDCPQYTTLRSSSNFVGQSMLYQCI